MADGDDLGGGGGKAPITPALAQSVGGTLAGVAAGDNLASGMFDVVANIGAGITGSRIALGGKGGGIGSV